MNLQFFLKSKIATVLLSLGLVLVVFVTGRLMIQKNDVAKEINKLEAEAERINGQNKELVGLINYLKTDEYKEREAREKLNLKKEGEYVVGLPKDEIVEQTQAQKDENRSNKQKWFDYFFRKES